MSFARTVKKELVSIPVNRDEMLAELSAFLDMAVDIIIRDRKRVLTFKTNNPATAQRFIKLIKTLYQADVNLITKKEVSLSQKDSIIIEVISEVDKIINEHDLLGDTIAASELITQEPSAKKAYIRSAFLVSGSINHPKTAEYHMEIYSEDADHIVFIQSLINYFGLNAKITKRRKGYIAYLKEAAAISDFIQLMGAINAVFQFEDVRIKRDFNNSINRVINCEIANQQKTIEASAEQIKDIEFILSRLSKNFIDDKMQETIDLRLKYPDASLRELTERYAEMYGKKITRSGLNHRIKKIRETVLELKEGKHD